MTVIPDLLHRKTSAETVEAVLNLLPEAGDPDWATRPDDLRCDIDRARGLLAAEAARHGEPPTAKCPTKKELDRRAQKYQQERTEAWRWDEVSLRLGNPDLFREAMSADGLTFGMCITEEVAWHDRIAGLILDVACTHDNGKRLELGEIIAQSVMAYLWPTEEDAREALATEDEDRKWSGDC